MTCVQMEQYLRENYFMLEKSWFVYFSIYGIRGMPQKSF